MNSHVVPEFLYKPLYDEKHRTLLFEHRATAPGILQKGLREPLLCEECEQRIQVFEDYFARYWYQIRPVPEKLEGPELLLAGVDYRRFKLFVLSIAWRASVSRLPQFTKVGLGPHEDAMRRMILDGSPGPDDQYPILAGLIVDTETREVWDQVMLAPLKIKVRSHWAIRMVFGGTAWTVLTSSHQTLPLEGYSLTQAGELRLRTLPLPDFVRESGLAEAVRGSLGAGPG